MSRILYHVLSAPYTTIHTDEAHDLIMASTAYGHESSVLFSGDGVHQLAKKQSVPDGFKHAAKRISAFNFFDIEPLYVSAECLDDNDIVEADLIEGTTLISRSEIKDLMANYDFCIKL